MDWSGAVDAYCERTDPSYWSEPLNAVSNLAFIIAAVVTWRMARESSDRAAQVLALGAGAVGVGSYLFHTHATVWALQADVFPIRLLVLAFIACAAVRFFAAPWWAGLLAAVAYLPISMGVVAAAGATVGRLNGSVGYLTLPLLILAVAATLWRRSPSVAKGLVGCASVFVLSLFFRTIDLSICPDWPVGTHFLWHSLNGLFVGWMIAVFIRAREPQVSSA